MIFFSGDVSTSVGLSHTSIIIIAFCISVTIFFIVIFIAGFSCKCIAKSAMARASDAQLSEPTYSECTYPLKQEETPEMVDNVAYGLVK